MLDRPLTPEESAERLARARLAQVQFASGRVLGSMSTTPHPGGVAAFQAFHEANLGNSRLSPGIASLELELLDWLGKLVFMPNHGLVTSGASEANLLALWAARQAEPRRRVVLYGANAHFSLAKAIDLLGLEGVAIPLGEDQTIELTSLEARAGDGTLALVGQAGSTELGLCDDLKAMGRLARDVGSSFHVDAAFGGFILPFLDDGPEQWRSLGEMADTLAVDPHKLGRAPTPAGAFLVREEALLEGMAQTAPYLTRETQVGVLGTRCSAGVAGAWATVAAMGRSGYRRQARECMANTRYLIESMSGLGLEPVVEPQVNIAAFELPGARRIQRELMDRGWYPSRMDTPIEALRIVVMPHVTPAIIDAFTRELAGLLD